MKFSLVNRSETYLEYHTGAHSLCIDQEINTRPPLPSFAVQDIGIVKSDLVANGCVILLESHNFLNFRDPFGIHYAVVQK